MNQSQTFQEHLAELRRRLMWVGGALIISGCLGYILRNPMIHLIQAPLGSPLYYTTPAGSFNFVIKVATVFAIFITLPVIIYQLVRFIEPALSVRLKTGYLIRLIISSCSLAAIGILFGYYVIIPMSLNFFGGYSSSIVKPLISANEYLSFVISILVSSMLMFQIPLLILFINYVRPLKPRDLLKYQKHVVIGSFIVAVILPFTYSPISQFVLALPIIILYYFSVLVVIMVNRKRNKTGDMSINTKYASEYNLKIDEGWDIFEDDTPQLELPKHVASHINDGGLGLTMPSPLKLKAVPKDKFVDGVVMYAKPKPIMVVKPVRKALPPQPAPPTKQIHADITRVKDKPGVTTPEVGLSYGN